VDKRYQVFVSSTYQDLREERQEVMQALLELDCIPSGMELFPAANEDQWTIIKKVIDDCDYYIVVCAGRYGSIGPSGKSYTQMEYEYAVSTNKPIIGFIHSDPSLITAAKTEASAEGKMALEEFRQMIQKKGVRTFSNPGDLGSVVSRSVIKLIKTHPAVGWIRGDATDNGLYSVEILRLQKENEVLRIKLNNMNDSPPVGAKELAQGTDIYVIVFDVTYNCSRGRNFEWTRSAKLPWNEISRIVLPLANIENDEEMIAEALKKRAVNQVLTSLKRVEKEVSNFSCTIDEQALRTILVQFQALGLIQKVVISGNNRWKLTTHGEAQLVQLYAIKKKV